MLLEDYKEANRYQCKQLAKIFGVHPITITRWIDAGHSVKVIGKKIKVVKPELVVAEGVLK